MQPSVQRQRFVGGTGILEDSHYSVEADSKMRNAYGFDHCEDNSSLHDIPRLIASMWFLCANVKVGEISRAGSDGEFEPRKQRATGRGEGRRRPSRGGIRTHAFWMLLPRVGSWVPSTRDSSRLHALDMTAAQLRSWKPQQRNGELLKVDAIAS
jgi:hypothetical protein